MINISDIKIPYEKVLLRLGYSRSKTLLDEKTEMLIKEMLEAAQKIIKPKAVIAFENINIVENITTFESGYKIESYDIAKLLDGCFKAYGVAVTIGSSLENKRNDFLSKKETFKGLIFDAAGSVIAEEAITSANVQIRDFEEKNNNLTTKRYSPGYGDWHLSGQKEFLKWLGAEQIGISLTPGFLMKPEKSVSALIGVKTRQL